MHPATDIAGICARAWSLAEPLVRQAGLDLYDVEYKPDRGRMVLRVYLQRPGGRVSLDELTAMSRQLGDVFDAHDAVAGRYQLECSSPGLERALRREAHFRGALGERVSVRVREPVAERRLLKGTLRAVGGDGISIDDAEVGVVDVPFAVIREARTEFVSARKGAPGSRRPSCYQT
jgi:ribosome maturation factor RimP